MSNNSRVITRPLASVTDLLRRLQSTWPAPDNAQSPGLIFNEWYAEAHGAIENGLYVLSASWLYEGETNPVRDFPALEFRELEESIRNLVSGQYTSRSDVVSSADSLPIIAKNGSRLTCSPNSA